MKHYKYLISIGSLVLLATCLALFGVNKKNVVSLSSTNTLCKSQMKTLRTYDELKEYILSHSLKSLDALIPCLPVRYLETWVLMFESHSLQTATPQMPRAILYGADSRLVLTFTGDSQRKEEYNTLETMEFDEISSVFKLKEITFSPDGLSLPAFNEQPISCVQCHGSDSKPIWHAYNQWTGAYFGRNSKIVEYNDEAKNLELFVRNQKHRGRYQNLSERHYYLTESFAEGLENSGQLNRDFNETLAKLNYRRIARKIIESKDFEKFKYAIFGAALGCSQIETFLPDEIKKSFKASSVAMEKETTSWLKQEQSELELGASKNENVTVFELEEYSGGSSRMSNLRYLMENRGLATHDWHMNLDPNFYSTYDGHRGMTLEFITPHLAKAMGDPEIVSQLKYGDCKNQGASQYYFDEVRECLENTNYGLCNTLRVKSLNQLNGIKFEKTSQQLVGFVSCIRCHGPQKTQGPRIHFEDSSLLRTELAKTGYPKGRLIDEIFSRIQAKDSTRMPKKGLTLSPQQIEELKTYLNELIH